MISRCEQNKNSRRKELKTEERIYARWTRQTQRARQMERGHDKLSLRQTRLPGLSGWDLATASACTLLATQTARESPLISKRHPTRWKGSDERRKGGLLGRIKEVQCRP